MIKIILALSLFFSATTTFAEANLTPKAELEFEVLKALINQSKDIELVEQSYENETEYVQFPWTLTEIIAGALAQNYLSGNNVLSATSVNCEVDENTIVPGAALYGCRVTIGNGDFETVKNGLQGPITESAYIISIDVEVPTVPNAKPRITTTKAVVYIAG